MPELNPADMALQEAIEGRQSATPAAVPRVPFKDQFKLHHDRAQAAHEARQARYERLRAAAVYGNAHEFSTHEMRKGLLSPKVLPALFDIPLETPEGTLLGLHMEQISPEDMAALDAEIVEAYNAPMPANLARAENAAEAQDWRQFGALKGPRAAPSKPLYEQSRHVQKQADARLRTWFQAEFGDDAALY